MVYGYVRTERDGLYALVVNGREVAWTTDPDQAGRDLAAILKKHQQRYIEEKQLEHHALVKAS